MFASVVLVGTIYPLVLEAFTGTQVGVGKPFYNRLTVPLSFALLLTMGLGSVTPWRHAAGPLVWNRIRGPLQVALAAGLVTAVIGTRLGWVVLAVVASVFVIGVIVRHLTELAGRRSRATGRGFFTEAPTRASGLPPARCPTGWRWWRWSGLHLQPVGPDLGARAGRHSPCRVRDTAPFQHRAIATVVGAKIEVHWTKVSPCSLLQPLGLTLGIPSPAVARSSGDVT